MAAFASGRYQYPYVRDVLKEEFGHFFQKQVLPYGKAVENGLNLLGSVAFYAESILRETAQQYGIAIQNLLKAPMDGLIAHFKPQIKDLLRQTDFDEDMD